MTDAPRTTPSDSVTPLLPASQIYNAVATRILNDVYTGMTTSDEVTGSWYIQGAHDEMYELAGDPAKAGVLQSMAAKIESHDPSLGVLQATVDRDPKTNDITGFTFADPKQESAYNQRLNTEMLQGSTLKQVQDRQSNAVASGVIYPAEDEYDHGVVHLDSTESPATTPVKQR